MREQVPRYGPDDAFRFRQLPLLLALLLAGCQPIDDPRPTRWVADLQQSAQVLSMDYESRQGPVSGTGTLSSLFDVGDPATLTYTGEQRGDTVDITFSRPGGDGFRYLGAFRPNGTIVGALNGVEFNAVPATFRRPRARSVVILSEAKEGVSPSLRSG